jgi:hypothetical protein
LAKLPTYTEKAPDASRNRNAPINPPGLTHFQFGFSRLGPM